jgi:hypothetical protein
LVLAVLEHLLLAQTQMVLTEIILPGHHLPHLLVVVEVRSRMTQDIQVVLVVVQDLLEVQNLEVLELLDKVILVVILQQIVEVLAEVAEVLVLLVKQVCKIQNQVMVVEG